jgi:hypothetical protein
MNSPDEATFARDPPPGAVTSPAVAPPPTRLYRLVGSVSDWGDERYDEARLCSSRPRRADVMYPIPHYTPVAPDQAARRPLSGPCVG